jgi:hypothetical protein
VLTNVNFPVISRISLTNNSEMCRSSGHKEEVTRSSVIAALSIYLFIHELSMLTSMYLSSSIYLSIHLLLSIYLPISGNFKCSGDITIRAKKVELKHNQKIIFIYQIANNCQFFAEFLHME